MVIRNIYIKPKARLLLVLESNFKQKKTNPPAAKYIIASWNYFWKIIYFGAKSVLSIKAYTFRVNNALCRYKVRSQLGSILR